MPDVSSHPSTARSHRRVPVAKQPTNSRRARRNGAGQNGHRNANLDAAIRDHQDARLTSDQGVPVGDDQNSLRAGVRGPTLLEDFLLREKITHFDHERIPERVVHARGAGAHGYFQLYESLADITSAAFLNDPAVQTPV